MTKVTKFVFSPFQENTYVLHDDSGECVIIDPGCYTDQERAELSAFIKDQGLTPVRLLNTHCHLDHIFGNRFVHEEYGLLPECHKGELPLLQHAPQVAEMYGVRMQTSPMPERFIAEGDVIRFGNTELETLFTPGHSPASICFFCRKDRFLIAGDTLFFNSIGRTDLPRGDHETLLNSIREQIFPLGDDVVVYAGHMGETSIGFEKKYNPFLS
jgi:glyoxylase-like metal-dependent hydrolase (beta-lactamase superfamily II)